MLKGIVPRDYQTNIVDSVLAHGNTLAVLPTGLGKTLIALMLIDRLASRGRILFLAPTRPLAEQHYKTIMKHLDIPEDDIILITGTIPPKKRAELWGRKIIVATPQTVKNDHAKGLFSFSGVSFCIVDEAHRSIGNYAYTYITKECISNNVLILGLTASPGGDPKRIKDIMANLAISNVELRTRQDEDVKPFVKEINISWVKVELDENLTEAAGILREMVRKYSQMFREWGMGMRFPSKKNLVAIRSRIDRLKGGAKYTVLSHYTTFFNLVHMLELLETQGVSPFLKYIEKLKASESKGAKRILASEELEKILKLVEGREHPKMKKLLEIVNERREKKMIIFTQYRERLGDIVSLLKQSGLKAEAFIGQRKGMTQEIQKKALEDFRNDVFNIMVATSIGEEGLDVPSVDTVIFYEPIPSEIRSIQRRGRAGRAKAGEVLILVTSGTQDEGFYWSSIRREKKMHAIIKRVSREKTEEREGKERGELKSDEKTKKKTRAKKTKTKEKPKEKSEDEKPYATEEKQVTEEKQTSILDFI